MPKINRFFTESPAEINLLAILSDAWEIDEAFIETLDENPSLVQLLDDLDEPHELRGIMLFTVRAHAAEKRMPVDVVATRIKHPLKVHEFSH